MLLDQFSSPNNLFGGGLSCLCFLRCCHTFICQGGGAVGKGGSKTPGVLPHGNRRLLTAIWKRLRNSEKKRSVSIQRSTLINRRRMSPRRTSCIHSFIPNSPKDNKLCSPLSLQHSPFEELQMTPFCRTKSMYSTILSKMMDLSERLLCLIDCCCGLLLLLLLLLLLFVVVTRWWNFKRPI